MFRRHYFPLERQPRGSKVPLRVPRPEALQVGRISSEPLPEELGVEVESGLAKVRREGKEAEESLRGLSGPEFRGQRDILSRGQVFCQQ